MERTTEFLIVYLDTHIACRLYEKNLNALSQKAKDVIEAGTLVISPIVELELQYLYEIGRILETPDTIFTKLTTQIDVRMTNLSYAQVVKQARSLSWTRDPFDRLIVAEVMLVPDAVLVTQDRIIREHCERAVW